MRGEQKGKADGLAMCGLMDRDELFEHLFNLGEWDLVWAVGKGFGWILVDFHEDAIDSCSDGASS